MTWRRGAIRVLLCCVFAASGATGAEPTGPAWFYGSYAGSGNTLTTYVMTIRPDGSYEMQRYARTLTQKGMIVRFQRLRDGEPVRSVEGQLLRKPEN